MKKNILLPGIDNQLKFLLKNIPVEGLKILIIGPGTAPIADHLNSKNNNIQIITEDYDSMIETRLDLDDKSIPVKIMEYSTTDFEKEEFDLVYAQASISSLNRNKIIKEIKRVLKPVGYLCPGEIVKLNPGVPKFVSDIWDRSELLPLFINDIERYYEDRNFEIIAAEDQSHTLQKFYEMISEKIKIVKSSEELKKKTLNPYTHEVNAYTKLGGDKFMGFKSLLLKKVS